MKNSSHRDDGLWKEMSIRARNVTGKLAASRGQARIEAEALDRLRTNMTENPFPLASTSKKAREAILLLTAAALGV